MRPMRAAFHAPLLAAFDPCMRGPSMRAAAVTIGSIAQDLLSLCKPRLSGLVICTAAGGMGLAGGGISVTQLLTALFATAGTVGAANALNCYLERDGDRLMHRTKSRPLPAGRMEPAVALWFGVSLAALSLPALALGVNLLTGLLGLLAFVSYVFVYTPMKARSHHAMIVGALPGALPPLMGWTAVTGKLELPGLVLFGILFFWQFPHFLAIALFRKDEYAAAGLHSVPIDRGDEVSRRQLLLYTLPLLPLSLSLYPLKMAGLLYTSVAAVSGAAFLAAGVYGFVTRAGRVWAKRVFLGSLLYLTVLFLALLIDGGHRG